tara:strand:- start:80 stop:283 length:204 start_codon:yes stop_codon:yes gene_type:complete
MPQRTLRFRIRPDGLVEESVEGVVGDTCHQLTKNLEEDLGTVERTEPTADAYLQSQDQAQSISAELH